MFNNNEYLNDLRSQYDKIDISYLENKSILITGACGMICSYLIDLLIFANTFHGLNIKIYALGRNIDKINQRFNYYKDNELFIPVVQDVCNEINIDSVDFIIHGASNANPKLYINDPVGTMNGNYLGTLNLLNLARKNNAKFLYISSGDVYGSGNNEYLSESDYGYVDILDVRSSYSSSKRASETLCASFAKQFNVYATIVRPAHIYGPTFTPSDSRAVSDFLRNVINNEDIIMHSDGSSIRSYCYVGDAVTGILKVLESGLIGEAYNISNVDNIISLKKLADMIAKVAGKQVIVDLPNDDLTKKIDSNVKVIRISNSKLSDLGWNNDIDIEEGIKRTLNILNRKREIKK